MRYMMLNTQGRMLLFFIILLQGYVSHAHSVNEPRKPEESELVDARCVRRTLPRDPEVPWDNDPDITAISDERIVYLWKEIMLTYRRNNPFGRPVTGVTGCSDYTSTPVNPEDQEILIDALSHALDADSIDWNYVRTVLVLMVKGMDTDPRIPELAHQMFTVPRGTKMCYDYIWSLFTMMSVLGRQNSQEAAQLLFDACHREYWGSDPMNIPLYPLPGYSEVAITSLRKMALPGLAGISHEISLPFLEALAADYPETHEVATLELETGSRAQPTLAHPIDLNYWEVQRALNRVLERQAAASNAEEE